MAKVYKFHGFQMPMAKENFSDSIKKLHKITSKLPKLPFEYDLEKGEMVEKRTLFSCAVRYYNTDNGVMVEIGDSYRHNMSIEAKYWNRIIKIIKDDELDKSGIDAVIDGLMSSALHEEKHKKNLISAIKKGDIEEIKNVKAV